MKLKIKLMPAIMTIISALYFIYVIAGEDTTLSADAVGGDPGGKVLPVSMAVFMFFGFLYLTMKERPDKKNTDSETRKLFLTTLVLSLLYVLLIKHIGFIVLTTILLFTLEYIFTTVDEVRNQKAAVCGGIVTLLLTMASFTVMRVFTRALLSSGRNGTLPGIFSVSSFVACICLIYVVVLALILYKTLYRRMCKAGMKRVADAGLLTVTTVLFLYVVFKQFFNVNLASGIMHF